MVKINLDKTMKLQLAYCPTACSMVPFILLKEANADFETLDINLGKGEHLSPEYLKINPKAKVPALIIDGKPLTENMAIQLWISKAFPLANLMPADSFEYFKAVSVMSWCSSAIHPKLTQQARPERYSDLPGATDRIKAMGSDSMFEFFAIANEMLKDREWFFDHFTCADAYFYWCFKRGTAFGRDQSIFKNCHEHMLRMEMRASVQSMMKHDDEVRLRFNQV
jgi:glutathione S-transferase